MVVLVSSIDGKKMKNTNGIIYKDEYVRINGEWLIAKRLAKFTWRDDKELNTPS